MVWQTNTNTCRVSELNKVRCMPPILFFSVIFSVCEKVEIFWITPSKQAQDASKPGMVIQVKSKGEMSNYSLIFLVHLSICEYFSECHKSYQKKFITFVFFIALSYQCYKIISFSTYKKLQIWKNRKRESEITRTVSKTKYSMFKNLT